MLFRSTSNAPAVCLGDAFTFTNTTTGAAAYSWDFGDGTGTSSLMNPTYTYTSVNSYTVQLVAVSSQNCSDTVTGTISVNTAPQIAFSADILSGCIPLTVDFTNATTNATNYLWIFGDGNSSADVNPVHDFLTEGTFTVVLYASVGSCAESDSVTDMITKIGRAHV